MRPHVKKETHHFLSFSYILQKNKTVKNINSLLWIEQTG